MDSLALPSNGETQSLNTEITEGRTQRAQRKTENILRLLNLLKNSPLYLCALCVLCGEMFFLRGWKAWALAC